MPAAFTGRVFSAVRRVDEPETQTDMNRSQTINVYLVMHITTATMMAICTAPMMAAMRT